MRKRNRNRRKVELGADDIKRLRQRIQDQKDALATAVLLKKQNLPEGARINPEGHLEIPVKGERVDD